MKLDKLVKMVSGGKTDVTYPELVEICRLMQNAAIAIEQGDRVARRMFNEKDYAEVVEMQRNYLESEAAEVAPVVEEKQKKK